MVEAIRFWGQLLFAEGLSLPEKHSQCDSVFWLFLSVVVTCVYFSCQSKHTTLTLLTTCACCLHHLLGEQSTNSRSSKAAPPLTSLERIPSNITSKFLSFLRGISARFQTFPWCPVLFHTSRRLFSVCREEQHWQQNKMPFLVLTSTLISSSRASNRIQTCGSDYGQKHIHQTLTINWATNQEKKNSMLKWGEIHFWPECCCWDPSKGSH